MTTKTRHCDECGHYTMHRIDDTRTPCSLGHKPRFYMPGSNPHDPGWGWKRRCEDFKERKNGHPPAHHD